ncbi:MAG: NifB/NifX family molybdenum-iron cluster-binding protein [Anaerolineales bacterium]|nr:NifB/NifX family molybdenum-iron cluster-binding protein [Anaerolineales bacterium]
MKIAFSAADDKGLDSSMSHHFGRCPFYVLVDVDGETVTNVKTIKNPFSQDHQPGMVPQFIFEQHANVMVTGGMGRRAIDFFSIQKIEVATGADGLVREALKQYRNGELLVGQPCTESEEHHHQ